MTTMSEKIARLIRPEIHALAPYHVQDAQGLIKLDAMENPYVLPEDLVEGWLETLRSAELNRYPDGEARRAKQRLREFMQVPAESELLLGNGSDELIQMLLLALARPGACVLAPVPTFSMYELIATYAGVKFVGVPLTAEFALDLPALHAALAAHNPAAVLLASPNNPSGNLFDAAAVEELIRAAPGLVLLDEAYAPFAGATFLPRLPEFDNLLILRTVSKLGLAGLRLGMLAGAPAWIAELDRIRLPYNINTLTQLSAAFVLRNRAALDEQVARICAERTRLHATMNGIPGVRAYASDANFVLLRLHDADANAVFERLLDEGVLVKNLHRPGTALAGCLRVTVGKPRENDAFLAALAAALGQSG